MGKNQSKDYLLDLLRIIATLLVVFGHCSFYQITVNSVMGVDWTSSIVDQTRFIALMNRLTALVYSCHMELFMFLSGMVFGYCLLNNKYPEFGKMARGKAGRLLVPYLTVTFLYNVPILVATSYIRGSNGKELIENIGLYFVGFGKNHLWYLPALFVITLLCYGLHRLVSRARRSALIDWAVIICLLAIRSVFSYNIWEGLYLDRIVEYFVWFDLGRVLYGYREPLNRRIGSAKALLAAGTAAAWLAAFNMHSKTPLAVFEVFAALAGIAFWYVIALCGANVFSGKSITKLLSAKSMAIYLYGVPINYVVVTVLLKIRPSIIMSEAGSAALFFARFALQILGALLVDFFVQSCKKACLERGIFRKGRGR